MGACTISKQTEKAEYGSQDLDFARIREIFQKHDVRNVAQNRLQLDLRDFLLLRLFLRRGHLLTAGSPIPRGSRDGAGLSRSPPRFEERGGFGPKSGRPAIYGPKSKRKTAETFVEKLSSSSEREARRLQIGFWRKEGVKNRGKLFDWLTR